MTEQRGSLEGFISIKGESNRCWHNTCARLLMGQRKESSVKLKSIARPTASYSLTQQHESAEDLRLIRKLFSTCMTADVSVSGSTECQAALIDSVQGP